MRTHICARCLQFECWSFSDAEPNRKKQRQWSVLDGCPLSCLRLRASRSGLPLKMNDFYRVWDVRGVLVVHRNDESSPNGGRVLKMGAQLNQEQSRLTVVRLPIGQLGKVPNFLEELHYFHFGVHTLN